MKVKNNMPSKAQIRNFNAFLKCFIDWFKSQDRDKQIAFLHEIKCDDLIIDDLIK